MACCLREENAGFRDRRRADCSARLAHSRPFLVLVWRLVLYGFHAHALAKRSKMDRGVLPLVGGESPTQDCPGVDPSPGRTLGLVNLWRWSSHPILSFLVSLLAWSVFFYSGAQESIAPTELGRWQVQHCSRRRLYRMAATLCFHGLRITWSSHSMWRTFVGLERRFVIS